MGIRLRATGIAIGALLVVVFGQPAKADTWHATGQTDFAYCASAVAWECSNISYSLDLTTGPPVLDITSLGNWNNVFLLISAVSGQINGVPVSCPQSSSGICGDLFASRLYYPGPPVPDKTFN
jgi:hypothetical protein